MEEKILEAIVEYISKTPIWLFLLVIIYMIGLVIGMVINEMKVKRGGTRSKIVVFVQGAAFTAIIFCIMNIKEIITSSITLKIIEERLLSSALASLAIVGLGLLAIYIKKSQKIKGK